MEDQCSVQLSESTTKTRSVTASRGAAGGAIRRALPWAVEPRSIDSSSEYAASFAGDKRVATFGQVLTVFRHLRSLPAVVAGCAIAVVLLVAGPASPAAADSPRSEAATVERLYQAYFGRTPDPDGHGFWIGRLQTDLTLVEIAEQFETSPEFVATYGSLSDRQFVELIYTNVLDRTPDEQGLDYWTGALAAGQSRASVMVGFSESLEFVIARSVDPGQVRRLYLAYFEREPDAAGLRFWVETNANGASLQSLSASFALSNEFVTTYGDLDDAAFVRRVYTNVLGRVGDQQGFDYWLAELTRGGIDRGTLMTAFSESPEFIVLTNLPTRPPATPTDPDPQPDPQPDPPVVDRFPSCDVEITVEQQEPPLFRLRMPTEDCLDLYPSDATLVWNHGWVVEGNDVQASSVPSHFFTGTVTLVHGGDSLFVGRFTLPNRDDPAGVSTDVEYRVNPLGPPTVEIGDVCRLTDGDGTAFANVFDPLDRRVTVETSVSGVCDPLWLQNAELERTLTLDGVPISDAGTVQWTNDGYHVTLFTTLELPAEAVGADGLLDLSGDLSATDGSGDVRAVAAIDLSIPVNGSNPDRLPAPTVVGKDVCIIDEAQIGLVVSEGGTNSFSLTATAPPAAATIDLQLPHECGGTVFPTKPLGNRSALVVDLQLEASGDRLFWGTPGSVEDVAGVNMFSGSDVVLVDSVSSEYTITVRGHIAFRTSEGELVALASVDRVIDLPVAFALEVSAPAAVDEDATTFPLTVSLSSDLVGGARTGTLRLAADTECEIGDPPVAGEPRTLYAGPLSDGFEITVDLTAGTLGCLPEVELEGVGVVFTRAQAAQFVTRIASPPTDVRIESSTCDAGRCSIVFSAVAGSSLSPSIQITGVAAEEFSTYGTNTIWVYPVAAPPVGERLVFAPYETLPVPTFCFHATGRPFDTPGAWSSDSVARCADLVDGSYLQRAPTTEEIARWTLAHD